MKFTVQVYSKHCQAKTWVIAGLRRNLEGEDKAAILNACVDTAKELCMTVKFKSGVYYFYDKGAK